jgi:RHS repeat-associated protein
LDKTLLNKLNFRGYDKLNRLLYSADAYTDGDIPYWDELNPDNTYDFENYNNHQESFLTVNVYDTLSTAFAGNIFYPPQDYYNAPNFSIGNLCATAYRTIGTEDWNLKYYRYDARGRVIKMWNIIDGFTSTFEYIYNSANQIARMIQNDDMSNTKDFRYGYDPWGYELTGRAYIDTLKYKFTGKERDKESTYDYFGARFYDSRIGRWLQMEPLYDKYLSFSPYQYGILNPVILKDINGKILVLGGDMTKALEDIRSLFNEDFAKHITINENGVVLLDINEFNIEDIGSDAAKDLIFMMVNSSNKYLYEVSDLTTGIVRDPSEQYNVGDVFTFNLNNTEKFSGIVNLSVTERNIDNAPDPKGELPKEGYSGQITLGTGKWTYPGINNKFVPRSDVIFHELAENYYRTELKQPYKRVNGTGAHLSANEKASKFKKQVSKPGEVGHYVPN